MSVVEFSTDFLAGDYALHRLVTKSAPWHVMYHLQKISPYFQHLVKILCGTPYAFVRMEASTVIKFRECYEEDSLSFQPSLETVNPYELIFKNTNESRINACLPYMVNYRPEVIVLNNVSLTMNEFGKMLQLGCETLILDDITIHPPPKNLIDILHHVKNVQNLQINISNYKIQNEDIDSIIDFKICFPTFGKFLISLYNVDLRVHPRRIFWLRSRYPDIVILIPAEGA